MKKLAILLLASLVVGCEPVLKTMYGIKKPRVEDKQSINSYLMKHKIDTSQVYTFKSLDQFAFASQLDMISIPDAMFFNKNGDFVPYKETSESCNADADRFMKDLESFSTAKSDANKKMTYIFNMLSPAVNEPKADVNVLITWTKYAGRLNKDKAFEWVKLLENAKKKGASVSYYLVNCDYQKSWNLTDQQLKSLNVKN